MVIPLFTLYCCAFPLVTSMLNFFTACDLLQLFSLMDKDRNGFILMKEFWDVMVLFAKGSPREKANLIFKIYDVSNTGYLTEGDLKAVLS